MTNYTSYLNIQTIRDRFLVRGEYVANFLRQDVFLYRRMLLGYVLLVCVLCFVAYKIYQNYFRVLRKYVYSIDTILYRFVQEVHRNKETIYQYDHAITMLFAAKKELIASHNPNYIDGYDAIKQEVAYLEKMIDKKITIEQEFTRCESMKKFIIKTRHNYQRLSLVLACMTFGLYRLAHKKLFY